MPEERDEEEERRRQEEDRKDWEERKERERERDREQNRLPRTPLEGASWFARFFSGLTDEKASRLMSFLLTLLVASIMVMLIWKTISVKEESIPSLLRSHEAQIVQITATFERALEKTSKATDERIEKFTKAMDDERRLDRTELRDMNKTITMMLSELIEWRRVFKKMDGIPEALRSVYPPFKLVPDFTLRNDRDLKPPELAPAPRGIIDS